MKKWIYLVLLLIPLQLKGGLDIDWCSGWNVEARAGAFFPRSHRVRSFYKNVWHTYQVEIAKQLACRVQGFVNIAWMDSHGHSKGKCHHDTHLWLVPVTLGGKYFFHCGSCYNLYVGAGLAITRLKIHDHYKYVKKHLHSTHAGAIIRTGAEIFLIDDFHIDLFADYLFQTFKFHRTHTRKHHTHVNLSGFSVGGSLGFYF